MTRYEPAGELASRDLVSRAIVREQRRTGGPVYLSMAASRSRHGCGRASRPSPRRADRVGLDLGDRSHSRRPGRALRDGRRGNRPVGPHDGAGPVCRRRGRVHRRPRRQSARQQLAARRPGVRRPRRAGDAAARRGRRAVLECSIRRTGTGSCLGTGVADGLAEEARRAGLDVELGRAVAGGGACCEPRSRRSTSGTRRSATIAAASPPSSPSAGLMARAALRREETPRLPRPRRLSVPR